MPGTRLHAGARVQEVGAENEVKCAQLRSCIPVSPVQLAGPACHPIEAQVVPLNCNHLRSGPPPKVGDMCESENLI